MMKNTLCPCGSNTPYQQCCGPLHAGEAKAATAVQLMRSRYTAWTMALIDYLFQTTYPAQQSGLNRTEMEDWAQRTQWLDLTIIDTVAGTEHDSTGEVEFSARFQLPPATNIEEHRERSQFAKENGQWFFVDPSLPARSPKTVGRNDPCPCGSGKKFKKCCG